jgi:hypothetical protein
LGGWAHAVDVSGNFAYIASHTDGGGHNWSGLQVVDISDPHNPFLAGSYSTPGLPLGVFVSGQRAYLASEGYGLYIFDISSPTNPILLGSYNTPGGAFSVVVYDNIAYVADGSSLQIIDVLNSSEPTVIGATPSSAFDVVVKDNKAYLGGAPGVTVLDVSDPTDPAVIDTCHLPSPVNALTITDSFIFAACGQSGLQIVNRTNLNLVGSYDTTVYDTDVWVSGDYAYVAYSVGDSPRFGGGLLAVDIQNPSNPTLASSYYSPGYCYDAWGVAVRDTLIFLTRGIGGLDILKFDVQTQPQTGYISVLSLGYEGPCNPTVSLSNASVRIYDQDLSYDESFVADELGQVDLVEVPVGTYYVDVSATGYVTRTDTTTVDHEGHQRSITVGLYPENPSLYATIPADGETVDDTKTAITLGFSKPMDLNSLNDPNLLTLIVDGEQIYPDQDYFIVQDAMCPETYHLYGDAASETGIEFGFSKQVQVTLSENLLDEDQNPLNQGYALSFATADGPKLEIVEAWIEQDGLPINQMVVREPASVHMIIRNSGGIPFGDTQCEAVVVMLAQGDSCGVGADRVYTCDFPDDKSWHYYLPISIYDQIQNLVSCPR